eukprot:3210191-Rhodomonas_salina.1
MSLAVGPMNGGRPQRRMNAITPTAHRSTSCPYPTPRSCAVSTCALPPPSYGEFGPLVLGWGSHLGRNIERGAAGCEHFAAKTLLGALEAAEAKVDELDPRLSA